MADKSNKHAAATSSALRAALNVACSMADYQLASEIRDVLARLEDRITLCPTCGQAIETPPRKETS